MRTRASWCLIPRACLTAVLLTLPSAAHGGAWQQLGPQGGQIISITADPVTPSTVYAGTNAGVFKSTDAGANWSLTGSGLVVRAMVVDPHTPAIVYAVGGNGVYNAVDAGDLYRSTDGGGTWTIVSPTIPTRTMGVYSVAVDSNQPTSVFAGATDGKVFGWVFKSTDAGVTWQPQNIDAVCGHADVERVPPNGRLRDGRRL